MPSEDSLRSISESGMGAEPMLRLMVMEESQGVGLVDVDFGLRVTGRNAESLMEMVEELEGSCGLDCAEAALVATVLEVGLS